MAEVIAPKTTNQTELDRERKAQADYHSQKEIVKSLTAVGSP
jgi:hypothetical protein